MKPSFQNGMGAFMREGVEIFIEIWYNIKTVI